MADERVVVNPMHAGASTEEKKISPETSASWFSHVFFTWVDPLFRIGNKKGASLQQSDLFPLSGSDDPTRVSETFERLLKKHYDEGHAKPVNAAIREQFGRPMMWAGLVKWVNSTLQFVPPILLNNLLQWLAVNAGRGMDAAKDWEGYVWAIALFLALSIRTLTENAYFHRVVRVGFQVRMAITTAVYRKSLRLSPVARQEVPVGQIVNLMQLDANRLDQYCMQFHVTWDGLYQITGYMILLGMYIGPSALAGLACMLLLIPGNFYFMMNMGRIRRSVVKQNDQRIKVTNEALQGIRTLKMYNWVTAFIDRMNAVRNLELAAIKEYAVAAAWNNTFMQSAPIVVALVTLLTYSGSGGDFTPARIFTALAVLNNLRFPLMFYPMVIQQTADAKVTLERLNRFIRQPEVEAYGRLALTDAQPAPAASAASAAPKAEADGEAADPAAPTAVPAEQVAVPVTVAEPAAATTDAAAAPATIIASSAARCLELPAAEAGIRISGGTFYWENPKDRKERMERKAAEEKEKAAKAAKAAKGKKPAAAPAAASAAASASGPAAAAAAAAAGKDSAAATTPAADAPAKQVADPGPVLQGLNITIPKGQLWAVVGSVGSGKSALCSAILGELAKVQGDVAVSGRVAFVTQSAWVLNATLKKNITFAGDAYGRPAREQLYQQVLDACQLRADIAVLPAGEDTEIGERGINLSGGQKQRVCLARCAYSGADVVVLDDPLSALDAEVGAKVFDACLCGILGGKTRLLVTNALQYLSRCDGVIMLKQGADGVGRVSCMGHFDELMATVPSFRDMMFEYGHHQGAGKGEGSSNNSSGDTTPSAGADKAAEVAKAGKPGKKAAGEESTTSPTAAAAAAGKTLMTVEEKNDGAVESKYYWRYLAAGGPLWLNVTILFVAYVLNQASQLASNYWLTFWTSDSTYKRYSMDLYMGIFVALGFIASLFAFLRVIVMSFMGIRASRHLHNGLVRAILRAPLAFFDTTPTGRILARFSKDMDAIDQQLPSQLGMLWWCLFFIIGTLAAVIFATPWFGLAVLPLCFVYVRIMNYFRNVSREVKRYDSITRSPVYAHFSEALGGLPVIRAYGLQSLFAKENERKIAEHISAWYTLKSCDRWLSIRLEVLGNVIVLFNALLAVGTAVLMPRQEGSAAGLAGFSLSYALSIVGLLNWAVRTAAETEQQMNSMERVCHYTDTTPQEPYDAPVDKISGKEKPLLPLPAGWPANGGIDYEKYRMCYRDGTPEVLHGISLHIKGGEKVGVVGRTGSGKSSMMASLFRLIEDRNHSGAIKLDGVDIDELSLNQLRDSLAIIPQEPVLFSGTIRSNLDPIGVVKDDAVLWAALGKVGLKETVERLQGGLNAPVAEGGDSLSQGQKQLFCLCRVLLRSFRVLLLDEATSSVDFQTDQAMQKTIREGFGTCTIITVAHRLNTVIDSDRIVVLDSGNVIESGHPHTLLSQPGSAFGALLDELGAATAAGLRARAADNYAKRLGGDDADKVKVAAVSQVSSESATGAAPAAAADPEPTATTTTTSN